MSRKTYMILRDMRESGRYYAPTPSYDMRLLISSGYVREEHDGFDDIGNPIRTGYMSITERGIDYVEQYRRQIHSDIIAWIGAVTGVLALLVSIWNTIQILLIKQ